MEKYEPFSLTGYAYVQDLDLTGEIPKLRIRVTSLMPNASEDFKDQVEICCQASPQLKKRLQHLDQMHPAADGVTAWFQVIYQGVDLCQTKIPSDDRGPHVLRLTGELVAVENWLRDGTYSFRR